MLRNTGKATAYGLESGVLKSIISVLRQNSKIKQVILFGSRAKGNYSVGSDIDLAIKGEGLTTKDIACAFVAFDDLYLPYKIDLVIYERINEPTLIEHIDRIGKVLHEQ